METKTPLVAVVILNWNGKHWLEKFLPSVVKYAFENQKIIVGDNASNDDSISFLQQHYPKIQIIKNLTNEGFAGGYQTVLKQVEADYFVLLNSDVEVTKNWIAPIIDWMESDEKLAACQPKIRSYHQPEMFEYAGAAGGFIDKNGFLFCRGRVFNCCEKDEAQYENRGEVFWATGAALFVKAKAFHLVGGLDAFFFAHVEEVDLCWRLKNAGFKIGYCPQSTVYHVGGGMLPQGNPKKTYLNFRNSLFLLFKNLPAKKIPLLFLKRTVLDMLAAMVALKEGKYKDTWAVMKAHFYFYCHLSFLIKTRKAMKKLGVFTKDSFDENTAGFYNQSIVWDFFIKKKKVFSGK